MPDESPPQGPPDPLRPYAGPVAAEQEEWYARFRDHLVRQERLAETDVAAGIDAISAATRGQPASPPRTTARLSLHRRRRTVWRHVAFVAPYAVVFFSLGLAAGKSDFLPRALTDRPATAVTWLTTTVRHTVPTVTAAPRNASERREAWHVGVLRRVTTLTGRAVGTVITVVKHSVAPYESAPEPPPARYSVRHGRISSPPTVL